MKLNLHVIGAFLCLAALMIFGKNSEALSDPLTRYVSWEVTCNGTAKALKPTSGFVPSKAFELTNGGTDIFLGGINVNATTLGYSVAANAAKSYDGSPAGLYCITAGGSSTVNLLGAD